MKQKLIRCKSCGAQIAKSAKHCPNCGAKQHQGVYTACVIVIILAVIGIVSTIIDGDGNTPAGTNEDNTASVSSNHATPDIEQDGKTNSIEVISISSQDLYDTYEENAVNADTLYKDKILAVTGEIIDITQDIFTKKPCIKLDVGDPYGLSSVYCFFKDNDEINAYIAELRDGETVTIYGKCLGVPVVDVQLSNCYFE